MPSNTCYTLPMQRSRTAPAATRFTLDTPFAMSRTKSRNRRACIDPHPSPVQTRRAERKNSTRAQPHHVREPAAVEADPAPLPDIEDRAVWPHARAPPPGAGLGGNFDLTDFATGRAFVVLATAGMRGLTGDSGGHGPVNPFAWAMRF
ncbi:unnamed protein product [Peniophora sp. CBMAI 1063]|nr:unnamed protein product [Peniophora sp. CBMAI 1063]